jgi:hypothetical protein
MLVWFESMKEHRKHLESVVFQYSNSTEHNSHWVIVLCSNQRLQTKILNYFLNSTMLPFHAQNKLSHYVSKY